MRPWPLPRSVLSLRSFFPALRLLCFMPGAPGACSQPLRWFCFLLLGFMGLQGPNGPRGEVRLFQRPEGNSFFSFSLWSLAFQLLYTFPTREKSFRLRRSPPQQPLTHDWYGLTAMRPAIFNPQ